MDENFFNLNNPSFLGIMWRFAMNIVFLFILVRIIYFKYANKPKFLFTFFLMGIMTFFICSILRSVYVEIGMAVGLFAIFGILRLRTRNFSIKDMAYTFTTIGISVINSLKLVKFPILGVIIINVIIIFSAYILEMFLLKHNSETHSIVYENIELLRPEKKQKLLKDVSALTGHEIMKVRIRRIDYQKKIAVLDISYKD
jgi:apolipoprotein N-acyltransferase